MSANAPRPNWFGRNWKWFVPVGCLTLLLLFVAIVGIFVVVVFGVMKRAEPYQHALGAAQSNPAVMAALGPPVEAGTLVSGNIQLTNDEGTARLSFPISGSKGEGKVYVDAHRVRGEWIYDVIEADVGTAARIDLNQGEEPPLSR